MYSATNRMPWMYTATNRMPWMYAASNRMPWMYSVPNGHATAPRGACLPTSRHLSA
jgi:hypothetical protein